MTYTIKIRNNGETEQWVRIHKIRHFLKLIRSIKWQDSSFAVYIKVNYGKYLDVHGKLVNSYNDGTYDNKTDFWLAAEAFMED